MWTNALVTGVWVVVAVAAALMTVSTAFWAVQRAADSRRARQRAEATRAGRQVTVAELQRRAILKQIDEANRQELTRLSVETVIRNDREFDAELAKAATESLAAVEPSPEETTDTFAVVPIPRPPLRPRRYLEARAAAGRAGKR